MTNDIHVSIYEHKTPMMPVKAPSGSTVRELLTLAKKELLVDGEDKRVRDVSTWGDQPLLSMDDKITLENSELYIGPHNY